MLNIRTPKESDFEEEELKEKDENDNRTVLQNSRMTEDIENQPQKPAESHRPDASSPFTPNEPHIQNDNSALIQLFHSYSAFINDSSDVILDMDLVLDRLLDAIKKLKPPQSASPHINGLWGDLLNIDKESVENYASSLKGLPENVLYDVLQNTERLYLKLAIEFEQEISRGKRLGIIKNDSGL